MHGLEYFEVNTCSLPLSVARILMIVEWVIDNYYHRTRHHKLHMPRLNECGYFLASFQIFAENILRLKL